jgi:hypothetical protein
MGHRRSVLAGLVAGAVAGFLVELLRPRGKHPAAPVHSGAPREDEAAQTEPSPRHQTPDPFAAPSGAPSGAPLAKAAREPAGSVPGLVPGLVPGSHRRDGSDHTPRALD